MSKIRKLKIEREIIPVLKDVHRIAMMKDSVFGTFNDLPLPKNNKEITSFIRQITELWRRSWILSPLTEIIEKLEQEIKR